MAIKVNWCVLDTKYHLMRADSRSFGNDFARSVVIFIVDNSPSSHTDNGKK